ncbi:hypothetical protein LG198_04185 [Methylobacillus arboreus]|uniref:hypothetical protein n=1 Tax=Methylobacillus arboreus TaxID=755170 RepID=UPI001E53B831|nr:hypothetical protein [Methylobacillus arboreus]MCB5189925.1 hypothetical protein [Methylobacillus arboreus]
MGNFKYDAILLGRLEKDLVEFEQSFLDSIYIEYQSDIPIQEYESNYHLKISDIPRIKQRVAVLIPIESGVPKNKQFIASIKYFCSALEAYGCFNACIRENNKAIAWDYFRAGVIYYYEWISRKRSVLDYFEYMRGNTHDSATELRIIKYKLANPAVTGYALERDWGVSKKTAEKILRRLTAFCNESEDASEF